MSKQKRTTAKRQREMWSYIAGEKGRNRIRVFAWPAKGDSLWIDYREGGKRIKKPLGHSDQDRAKRQADEVAGRLSATTSRPAGAVLTLRTLFDMYLQEVTPQKGKSAQDHDRRILPLLLKAFGAHRRPDTLNVRDWNSFIRRRQSGALALSGREGQSVRNRVIEQNLKLLLAVLNWAERARDDGGYLLDRNPLRGLKVPKEENPRRPMLTVEQFKALRSVAAQRSLVAERFVMLAWYAGHRGHSIRHLRWSDVDLEGGTIRWRAGNDKIKYEHRNPMHPDLIAFLKADRARTKAIGDAWLFPGNKRGKPLTRNQSVNLFRKLAVKAGLPKGEGYGWHACRRAFANHLRDVPLRDLKDLGGWKTERTVVAVYLQPNEDAQRSALAKLKGA